MTNCFADEEKWAAVPGYEGFLEASTLGRIKSLASVRVGERLGSPNPQRRPEKIMSPFLMRNGYLTVAPKFGDSRKKLSVHRLVAATFVPGFFDGACVNHIDGNRLNNRPCNLEWTTLAKNTQHQWQTGLVDIRGERHPRAKLKDTDVVEIKRRLDAGEAQADLAREYEVSFALISKIRRGKKPVPALPR